MNPNPQPIEPTPVSRRSPYPILLAGVLAGVLGTALLLPRLRPAISPSSTEAGKEGAKKEEATPSEKKAIELSAEAAKTAGIRVEAVKSNTIGEGLTVSGTVEVNPNRGAKITPPAPGKVVRLLVDLGDRVTAGQPLLVLDSYEVAQAHAALRGAEANIQQAKASLQTSNADINGAKAGVSQAQAELAQTQTRLRSAEIALQRQRDLAKAGVFSQAPLQTAQSELNEAQSELLKAQTELQSHLIVLQRTERLFKEELVSRSELEGAQLEQRQDEARVAQTQNRTELAKRTLERERRVFSGDLLSKGAVQTAEAEVRSLEGEVQKARQGSLRAQQEVRRAQKMEGAAQTALQGTEAAFLASRSNLYALEGGGHTEGSGGLLTLKAPISGMVTERTTAVGETVERTASLLVIENLNTVSVQAGVPEAEVSKVQVGQSVEVTVLSYPGKTFVGTVGSLAGKVDEKTRTLPVRCLVENPNGKLRPEMFARVRLGIGARSSALTVPLSALEEEGEDRFVYVEKEGKFERRKVSLGRLTETNAEIKTGLKAGERIAVEGLFVLKSETNKDKLKGDE